MEALNIEVPGPGRYKFARWHQGRKIRENIDVTVNGKHRVPRTGAVSAIANHRNRKWDVPIIGLEISDIRTPFYPAKKKYGRGAMGIKGWVMEGSGALFFDEENEAERGGVLRTMVRHLQLGHMVITLPEGTSRVRGQELGELEPGALEIALRTEQEGLILMGLGGTETSSGFDEDAEIMPSRVHLEIGSLALDEAREQYAGATKKDRKELVLDLTQSVVRPALQEVVDIAYAEIAARP